MEHLRSLIVGVFVMLLLAAACSGRPAKQPPVAQRGLLDLRGWDFEQDGPVKLYGDWEFFFLIDAMRSPPS